MRRTPPLAVLNLILSGNCWRISAGDAEASAVVTALRKVFSLPPENSPHSKYDGKHWRELRVIKDSGQNKITTGYYESEPLFCRLPPIRNLDRLQFGMSLIALAIARAELTRGGLLIHGALAAAPENIGGGIILAGPAEVGKTTASKRLPPPWRSLSDDTTLVVRDSQGKYMAHPWPTWSRFFQPEGIEPGSVNKWNVQEGVPLRGIFFLEQAKKDRINILSAAPAMTYLMETVQLVSSLMASDLSFDQAQKLHQRQFDATEEIVRSTPVYALRISLSGAFWEHLEKSLSPVPTAIPQSSKSLPAVNRGIAEEKFTTQPFHDSGEMSVCYSGPSMNPTLRHPDILQVSPYSEEPIRSGDIIYYPSPVDNQCTIHRIVRVTADGIYTRGDNNTEADPYVLQQKDITGRVTAAWRYGKYRTIAGGSRGILSGYRAGICKRVNRSFSPILHGIYKALASGSRSLSSLVLPASMKPRVVVFKQRYQPPILKLLVKGHVIGQYVVWKKHWIISRPWKLVFDETKLPIISETNGMEPLEPKTEFISENSY